MAHVTAQIVIAQAGNPAPGGYSSGSRDDIVVGSAVTVTNADNTSATWHRWTVSPYYPAGTLGGLGVTGDGTPTCTFEPDVEGDIAVTLEVAGAPLPGGGANYARQTVVLGIRAALSGYAPGMPLPHPLEAGRGQAGAVDPAVGREGRIDEAIYALFQGLSAGGGGGPVASIAWDTTVATNAATGTYATFAEVAAVVAATKTPITIRPKGTLLANVAGTYEWGHVTFVGNEAATLAGSEGVILRNVRVDAPIAITTAATTTRLLEYTAGHAAYLARGSFDGNETVGLVRANHAGDLDVSFSAGAIVGKNAIEQTHATTTTVRLSDASFAADTGGHVKGSLGTVTVYTTTETSGTFDTASFSGTVVREKLGGGAASPDLDANHVYAFDLNGPSGTTAFGNTGSGSATTLTSTGGGNDPIFGVPTPIGDGCLFDDGTAFTGSYTGGSFGEALTAEVWVECRFLVLNTGDATHDICTLLTGGSFDTFKIWFDPNTGTILASVETEDDGVVTVSGSASAQVGRYHIGVTYDGANVKLYVNGVLAATAAATGDSIDGASWSIGNAGDGKYVLRNLRVSDIARDAAYFKSVYEQGAFTGSATLDAAQIQGNAVEPGAMAAGDIYVFDGAALVRKQMPRAVVASLEWTATAGVYTIVSSTNIDSIGGNDYGSGTNSLQVILLDSVTNGAGYATTDPDWVDTFHVDAAGPIMISGAEVRIDFRNKADTQISPADGAGTVTIFGDL